MGVMLARSLRESLKKAQNVGIVEERVQLFDDCEVAVRNLRPDEYESIHAEIKELDGMPYLFGFQKGHVKRAIVELNGQDLRDVQFVEDEEDDVKRPGQMKTIKLELADWLDKNILSTWGKEAIYIVYRKAAEIAKKAGLRIKRSFVGSYITSLEMAGASITLLKLDEEMIRFWDAPVVTPALRWGA